MEERMRVREQSRKIGGLPVVKSEFLGWLGDYRQAPGYFSYYITYGVTDVDRGEQYQTHLMWSDRLDRPWRLIESTLELTRDAALAAFAEHEKLAVWPEGN